MLRLSGYLWRSHVSVKAASMRSMRWWWWKVKHATKLAKAVPADDLFCGALVDDIVFTIVITAIQADF